MGHGGGGEARKEAQLKLGICGSVLRLEQRQQTLISLRLLLSWNDKDRAKNGGGGGEEKGVE